ncbi:MAG: hypothetical protein J6S14_00140, partial [Clostridia bacterium]|nr:hypothetical protein [Clostridia bacterium]
MSSFGGVRRRLAAEGSRAAPIYKRGAVLAKWFVPHQKTNIYEKAQTLKNKVLEAMKNLRIIVDTLEIKVESKY